MTVSASPAASSRSGKHWGALAARPGKTLVFCPIGLGNFIMLTPALRALSDGLGRDNLHLVALKPGIRQMAEASGYFGAVHAWNPDTESKGAGLALMNKLRGEHYAASVSLFPTGNWRFSLFDVLAGAREKYGFAYPNSRISTRVQTVSVPLNRKAHDTDQNADFVDALLGRAGGSGPRTLTFPFAAEHPHADKLAGENYYVCHPGSSAERGMKDKRLPPAQFAVLAQRMFAEFGLKCQMIGGPEEQGLRDEIAALAPDAMLGETSRSLKELAGLIAPAKFYAGNDSGLMHISVALGKRALAFFGPTDDRRNGPYSEALRVNGKSEHLIVRRDDLTCSPCWTIQTVGANPPCIYGDTRCLQQFEMARAWPKIASFVADVLSA